MSSSAPGYFGSARPTWAMPHGSTSRRANANTIFPAIQPLIDTCLNGDVTRLKTQLPKRISPMEWLRMIEAIFSGPSEAAAKTGLLRTMFGLEQGVQNADKDGVVRKLWQLITRARQEDPDDEDDEDESESYENAIYGGNGYADENPNGDNAITPSSPQNPTPDPRRSEWYHWAVEEIVSSCPGILFHPGLDDRAPGTPTIFEFAINSGAVWVIPDFKHLSKITKMNDGWLEGLSRAISNPDIFVRATESSKKGRRRLDPLKKLIAASKVIAAETERDQPEQEHLPAILHAVISKGNLEMLMMLNREYPQMITLSFDRQNAMQMLKTANPQGKDREAKEKFIVSEILSRKISLPEVRLLLGTEKELYLDLTQFDYESKSFNAFIDRIDKLPIELQDVLLYVHFPELVARDISSIHIDRTSIHEPHALLDQGEESLESRQEAKVVLKWLRKKAHSIIDLSVPDNLHDPHWEESIEQCLSQFEKIERLNWRKLDLSLPSIAAAKHLQEVWLHSSGNWNSIAHWLSLEGVISLPHIQRVHIVFHEGLMSAERIATCQEYAKGRLSRLEEDDERLRNGGLKISLEVQGWPRRGLARSRREKVHNDRFATQILNLDGFLSAYRMLRFRRQGRKEPAVEVKVAIIDNGIDLSDEWLSRHVTKGASFYHSDAGRKESPWYLPSDPHGTQMARIILDLCQDVKLYIAKVGTDRRSAIRSGDVKKAMDWAIDEGVDIINMSMVIRDIHDSRRELEDKVHDAIRNNIAFIGSTMDHGSRAPEEWFPSPNSDAVRGRGGTAAITIAACDHIGTPLPTANRDAHYHIFGDRMAVKSSIDTVDEVSGSSVATAVATGLAAIVLGLKRYSGSNTQLSTVDVVYQTFDRMKHHQSLKPEQVFAPMSHRLEGSLKVGWNEGRLLEWARTFPQVI